MFNNDQEDNSMSGQYEIDPYQQFDYADDDQALAEIQGNASDILDAMVYSFSDRRGKSVTGLSLTGVRETVREMNRRGLARIHVSDKEPIIEENDDFITVKVYAVDDLNGGSNWGVKRQPKRQGNYENPFALEQALSKAQRNAMYGLIPAKSVVSMIENYKSAGQVRVISGKQDQRAISSKDQKSLPPSSTQGMSREDWTTFKSWRETNGLTEEIVLRALQVKDRQELLQKFRGVTLNELKERVIDGVTDVDDEDDEVKEGEVAPDTTRATEDPNEPR